MACRPLVIAAAAAATAAKRARSFEKNSSRGNTMARALFSCGVMARYFVGRKADSQSSLFGNFLRFSLGELLCPGMTAAHPARAACVRACVSPPSFRRSQRAILTSDEVEAFGLRRRCGSWLLTAYAACAPPPCPAATTTPPSTTTPRRAASAIAITSANRRRPRKRDTRHDTPLLRALPVSAVAIGGGRCQCRDRRCRSHRHHQRAGAAIRFIAGVPISVIARGASRQE